jgi:protein-disulfide isomerase
MTASGKTKKSPPVSAKQSAKERRALQQQRRERQKLILLTTVAVALLIAVVGGIVATVVNANSAASPEEAYIPPDALTRYVDFAQQKLMGTTPDGFPYLGAENAPVLLEEMSSLSCIACKNYHDLVMANLLDEIKAGRVKYVFIPVSTTGEFNPAGITLGTFCAARQGKFWEMQDIAFDWQVRYTTGANDTARLKAAAQSLGLDAAKFSDCLTNNSVKDIIDKGEAAFGERVKPDPSGTTGTPTLFLDGEQIQPRPDGNASPNLNELRGIIEQKAAAKKSP